MKFIVYVVVAVFALGILLMSWFLQKDKMSGLVMPGPLSAAHAKYENDCAQCHASFDKTNQSRLCLDCHTVVDIDIQARRGFHGRSPAVAVNQCKTCHTDHIGRTADIVMLDKAVFNHEITDFPLKGAHARGAVGCADCHRPEVKFREAPGDCFSCHKEDDQHNGQLGTNCQECHQPEGWLQTFFDHDKTDFPLVGEHQSVTCDSCHAGNRYENTPRECVSCHLINDIHDSPIDARCQDCHHPQSWERISFDHDGLTEFALKDKHTRATCEACHAGLLFDVKTGKECIDCHLPNDIHKGRNGTRCNECHTTAGWAEVAFDHDKDTEFALRGRHRQAQCAACHKENSRERKLDARCAACHVADDVHGGQLNDCATCHNEESWTESIRFDHDLSAFPLIGMHAAIGCEECHLSNAFKNADTACVTCHANDDTHKQTLGTRCEDCHNPNDWRLWEFDHATRTEFSLEGAHRELLCGNCHTQAVSGKIEQAKDCNACHARDNVHGGKFREIGTRCDMCHGVSKFTDIKEEQIKGFHDNPLQYGVRLAENCSACHINEDVHNGQFGRRCDRCHSPRSWKELIIGK